MSEHSHARFLALNEFCASRPGAVMSRRWGETVFTVRHRVFAFIGSQAAPSVTVKVERAARRRALARPSVRRARYVGIFGWLTVTVSDADSLEVAFELVERSYRLVAYR